MFVLNPTKQIASLEAARFRRCKENSNHSVLQSVLSIQWTMLLPVAVLLLVLTEAISVRGGMSAAVEQLVAWWWAGRPRKPPDKAPIYCLISGPPAFGVKTKDNSKMNQMPV